MAKIKILIVEDELLEADTLSTILLINGYDVCTLSNNSEDALHIFKEERPDLLLMDIFIKGITDSVYLALAMKKIKLLPLIFLTAQSDEQSLEKAKKAHPSAYIIKPYSKRDLKISIELALYNFSADVSPFSAYTDLQQGSVYSTQQHVFIKIQPGRFIKVHLDNILWLEADGNYTCIVTTKGKYLVSSQLSAMAARLNYSNFLRIHRSYLVNIHKIDAFEESRLFINNKEIPVSKNSRAEIFQFLKVI